MVRSFVAAICPTVCIKVLIMGEKIGTIPNSLRTYQICFYSIATRKYLNHATFSPKLFVRNNFATLEIVKRIQN